MGQIIWDNGRQIPILIDPDQVDSIQICLDLPYTVGLDVLRTSTAGTIRLAYESRIGLGVGTKE